ncbi:ANTAR domain-containing protein [Mycobacterium sp. HNNTM2301]|uniref:ANTAR domain-containing protein n=1 Tax=Mycobacterium hainanense TaxID=3289775 RepID=UPI0035A5B0B7
MTQASRYRPGDHRSRREIDRAIGVLMGVRRCSAEDALELLVAATRASGVGLGGVSRTLLSIVTGDVETSAAHEAVAHWQAVLDPLARRGC